LTERSVYTSTRVVSWGSAPGSLSLDAPASSRRPALLRFVDGAGSVRSFPARPSALAEVRRFIRERAAKTFHDEAVADLVLAVSEAAANAAVHSGSGRIDVTWRPIERGAEVVVEDRGVFKGRGRVSGRGGLGFGMPLIAALSDRVVIEPGTSRQPGTRVRLVKFSA
jgi:anti-sigma regulatory factor (Ser/Thr protein kinase)